MSPKRQPAKKVTKPAGASKPPSARQTPGAAQPSRARKQTAGSTKKSVPPALRIQSFGPIGDVNVEFGDLTVLVGPQATGKSIFLQMLKLVLNTKSVAATLSVYGSDWSTDVGTSLRMYFGEGYSSAIDNKSKLSWGAASYDSADYFLSISEWKSLPSVPIRKCVLIPAHRGVIFQNSWPRPFSDFSVTAPFALKQFSEYLRRVLDFSVNSSAKPSLTHTAASVTTIGSTIHQGFKVVVENADGRRRLVLKNASQTLPHLSWSTGQREFIPLQIAIQDTLWLPAGKDWFVVEEPELGLHPQGIMAVMLLLCEVLGTGRRVVISTHSPRVLDYVWALNFLQTRGGQPEDVLALFEQEPSEALLLLAKKLLKQMTRVYHFDGHPSHSADISTLDPFSENEAVAGWGGLLSSGDRIASVVASVANRGHGSDE